MLPGASRTSSHVPAGITLDTNQSNYDLILLICLLGVFGGGKVGVFWGVFGGVLQGVWWCLGWIQGVKTD